MITFDGRIYEPSRVGCREIAETAPSNSLHWQRNGGTL